jgi:hypothetical protein
MSGNGVEKKMTPRKKTDDHEIPTLTGLEAENITTRKKVKDHRKPAFIEFESEDKDRQPENKG